MFRKPSGLFAGLVGILLACAGPVGSLAATRYVETWGANTTSNCPKSNPCKDIQYAINQSGVNDRIVVGPGDYLGNLLIPAGKDGLRLESTAGRYATVVLSAMDDDGIVILSSRVRVGGKGKGFTFQGPPVPLGVTPTTTGHGIHASGERSRIEGNRFLNHEHGAYIENGFKASIRNNIALLNKYAGIQCNDCERAIIQDNRTEFNGTGIQVGASSERITIRRNVASWNGGNGIVKSAVEAERVRVQDNVVERNDLFGFLVAVALGTFQGNIAVLNGSVGAGLDARQNSPDGNARIRHNIAVLNSTTGLSVGDPESAKIENNFTGRNLVSGIVLHGSILNQAPRIRNNTSFNHDCGMSNSVADNMIYTGQYFAANTTEECGSSPFNPDSTTRSTPAPVRVNRARALVGG